MPTQHYTTAHTRGLELKMIGQASRTCIIQHDVSLYVHTSQVHTSLVLTTVILSTIFVTHLTRIENIEIDHGNCLTSW